MKGIRLAMPALLSAALLASGCNDSDVLYPPPDGGGSIAPGTGAGLNESNCTLQYTETTPAANTGADPQIGRQWHLNNTGQTGGVAGEDLRAFAAWETNRGQGVQVAVVDDAVEVVHQDLVANVVPGRSYNYRPARRGSPWPLPCSRNDDHGTAVAGIIAAKGNNALGISGVAPDVSLVGYNALATGANSDVADALNRDLGNNAIYQNSWGAQDDGSLSTAEATFITAIDAGIRTGRNGKGAIYVFAAGNGGCYATAANGSCFRENSNYDGYVNKLGVITACAVDHAGGRPFYGERGANFLVCGPSSNNTIGITTLALDSKYTSEFTGTSASTPMVSGVVALMLAANPALTWRDVRQVLARSARHNSPNDAGWTNNFGLNFNPDFGFGAADAQAAVALARTWTSIGGSESLKRCGPFRATPNLAIPDAGQTPTPIENAISVEGCDIANIEFVEIRLTAPHTYSGDLDVKLISPLGLVSELAGTRFCGGARSSNPCGAYDDWPFGSVRHLDEPGNGAWRLQLTDGTREDTGTLATWALTLYGR